MAPTREAAGSAIKTRPGLRAPLKDVEGKVAFITGGSSGIGLGIARAFAEAGMKVVIGYRTKKHLDHAMEQLATAGERVHAINVDVTDRAALQQAAAETIKVFGKVHVVVNNAGVHINGTLSDTSYEDWNWLMDVNVNGVLNGVQTFLPLIRMHGEGGQIIATSSVLGLFVWSPTEAAYSASKFAVVSMMESLRMELADTNIGVSVLCPGWVRSDLGSSNRNRYPQGSAPAISAQEAAERERQMQALVESGFIMDELEVGRRLLAGLRNNELYILTHPEWEQMMHCRQAALIAAVPRDVHPTAELRRKAQTMTEHSIYAAECARQRCE